MLASAGADQLDDPRCSSVYELAAGAVIGVALGLGGAWALRRAALPSTGLYPLAAISVCVLAYAGGQVAHASGLLATYVCALVLGNSDLPHRGGVLSFAEGTGWLAQIGLFVLLGLYASARRGCSSAVVPALVAAAVLLLAARPLSVIAAAAPFRMPWREQAFLSWAGLRGAVPDRAGPDRARRGRPGVPAARRRRVRAGRRAHAAAGHDAAVGRAGLGVALRTDAREVEVDAAPLDEVDADLLQVSVPGGSKLHGVYLRQLRLPTGATVSLVVREGRRSPRTGRPGCGRATSSWS